MATETVNGMEYNQHGQPAELAASIPSHHASASQNSNTASSQQQKADPQEIGWYFVEQYYTTLSKSPDKIHLFYNKKSQLITGTEAEKVLPAVGSKAISEKIKSLDLQECKIRVLNVDSQASYDNIVVQVIGEMSNNNQPHHKFVQTFILATQPNGYFVLNDIFRYLGVDEDEIVEDEAIPETSSTAAEQAPGEAVLITTPARADENVTSESAAEEVDEKLHAAAEEPEEAVEEVNGTDAATEDADETEAEPVDEPTAEEPEAPVAEPAPTPVGAAEESTATETTSTEPEDSAPTTTAATDAAPVKKTWASMVGNRAPTVPAVPQTQASSTTPAQAKPRAVTTSAQPQAKTPEPVASAGASTPTSQSNGWQEAGKKTKQQAKPQEGIVHAYIKNVNEKIDARVLREVLEKYGKLKYYDVSRPKQCAFVEFEDPAAYAAAAAENPHTVGSETINVEERRPRPGQTGGFGANYPRGGGAAAAAAGRGRGGPPQRSGSQGSNFNREATPAARGNFQGQRGNKPAGPARGRGQTPAA